MPNNKDPKTQIVQQIQDAENILVTVNDNPSVDELTSALGLTLLINKLGRRAVAVVSGDIPDALEFLKPEKTFEDSIDSLRDFIIALNKEKADHLRYKIEGDFVKVFITPYHTTISEKDLEFSQGEYNVSLIIALNVETKDKLDGALKVHGKILHDAVVSTINAGNTKSSLGTINWADPKASSLCEMIVGLASTLKQESDGESLMDEPIATALLTGIVSATDRFSNEKTNSLTMAIASKLMQFGADQQLVSTNLDKLKKGKKSGKGTFNVKGKRKKDDKGTDAEQSNKLVIDHEKPEEASQPDFSAADVAANKTLEESQAQAAAIAEQKLSDSLAEIGAAAAPEQPNVLGDLQQQTDAMLAPQPAAPLPEPEPPVLQGAVGEDSWRPQVAPFVAPEQPATPPVDAPKHGFVAPLSPSPAPSPDESDLMQSFVNDQSNLQPELVQPPQPEVVPATATVADSPFIPPAPPPAPTIDMPAGLPMPPGSEQPVIPAVPDTIPEPVAQAATSMPEAPLMPATPPASQVMPDEVYPSTPSSDVGSFRIPGQ